MKIEAGKYYRRRDGEKVGPMVRDQKTETPYVWDAGVTGLSFTKRGEVLEGVEGRGDLIAEWTDTPNDAPKLWRDMTPEEKGALLLAHHEGKVIEWNVTVNDEWQDWAACDDDCLWDGVHCDTGFAYRVKPEPTVETVDYYWREGRSLPILSRSYRGTHRITFNLIDGKPDLSSIRMEALE